MSRRKPKISEAVKAVLTPTPSEPIPVPDPGPIAVLKPNRRLSAQEKEYIKKSVLQDRRTDQFIAAELNRDIETVRKYRLSCGIRKTGAGKLIVDKDNVREVSIGKSRLSDDEKISAWIHSLSYSSRYRKLKEVLNHKDMDYFAEQWALYHLQLEDMTISEENSLEQMILLQVRMNDNHKQRRELQKIEEKLTKQFADKLQNLDLTNGEDRALHEMLMSNNRQLSELNKELKELTDKYTSYQKNLNTTREQREKTMNVGGQTLLTLLKSLQSEEFRSHANKYSELVKIAVDKQEVEFTKSHMFLDGVSEPILLDGAKIKDE